MIPSDKLIGTVKAFVREGFHHVFGKPKTTASPDPEWKKLLDTGTALWLDTGDIDEARKLWCAEFAALTTNNTLLNREVQKGIYDGLVKKAAAAVKKTEPGIGDSDLMLEIAFILNAYHGLRLVETFDVKVSVELHTDLAHDVDRTVRYGKRYFDICPERFYVKVPLTPAGYLAARKLGSMGVPINFTLGFSARQNYLAALLTRPSFVNVFMGRLNAFAADNHMGDGKNVGEKATLSTQRELLALRRQNRTKTMLIGASMRDSSQVVSLAGLDVYTMPPKVAAGYRASPAPSLTSQVHVDPPVELGAEAGLFRSLWEVPPAFKNCVDQLLKQDVDNMKPDAMVRHFGSSGFTDFLPSWNAADAKTIGTDGKIPVYEHWKSRLKNGEVGLDAIMNAAGFYSFAGDQKAFDDRVRSLL